MSLIPPPTVGKLQGVLRAKAKESPNYRFYALYDKVYRADVLAFAYERCRCQRRCCGRRRSDVRGHRGCTAVERWLGELAQELKEKTYRPAAVRRAWIPKGDGKSVLWGYLRIRDRVVQMAAVLVLEPIFDEDLQPEQHAYRADHSAHQALREVQGWLDRGLYGSRRRGLERLLRQHSAPRTDEVRGASRSAIGICCICSRCGWRLRSRRRTRKAEWSERPATRMKGAAPRKGAWPHRCWRICICGGSCWAGR